jgi:hypothetical protein
MKLPMLGPQFMELRQVRVLQALTAALPSVPQPQRLA